MMQFNINKNYLNICKRSKMVNKKLLVPVLSVVILTGCATKHATSYPPFTPEIIGKNSAGIKYTQKTNTLFTLIDTFSSTNDLYDSATVFESKLTIQKQTLNRINKTIPQNLPLYSGIRSFGFGGCVDNTFTGLLQDIAPHARYTFQYNIDKADCASGRSVFGAPLQSAIDATSGDLDKAQGNIALLIISDGHNLSFRAKGAAKALKDKFTDRLCIYTVWIGNKDEQDGQDFLNELTKLSGCGESVSFANIESSKDMGGFIEDMLYKQAPLVQVPIALRDSDEDGIFDNKDLCPSTPKGAPVNQYGCWTILDLEFDFDKATIRKGVESALDSSVKILNDNPYLNIQIEGHTDNKGSEIYNLTLSNRRAETVQNYLIMQGIKPHRLSLIGLGESTPITSNDTDEGRQLNRRVVFTIIK